MYTRIKELADSAVALQNKLNMEAALREIGSLCNMMLDSVSLASASLAGANIDPTKVKTGKLIEGEFFGMARIKKEGAAAHPDDIDAFMTPEQEARQLAAYQRDTGDVATPKKSSAKKAPKK